MEIFCEHNGQTAYWEKIDNTTYCIEIGRTRLKRNLKNKYVFLLFKEIIFPASLKRNPDSDLRSILTSHFGGFCDSDELEGVFYEDEDYDIAIPYVLKKGNILKIFYPFETSGFNKEHLVISLNSLKSFNALRYEFSAFMDKEKEGYEGCEDEYEEDFVELVDSFFFNKSEYYSDIYINQTPRTDDEISEFDRLITENLWDWRKSREGREYKHIDKEQMLSDIECVWPNSNEATEEELAWIRHVFLWGMKAGVDWCNGIDFGSQCFDD